MTYLSEHISLIEETSLFDTEWYCKEYQDVSELGIHPIDHYLKVGAILLRDPSPYFSTSQYYELFPEHYEQGINPLVFCIEQTEELVNRFEKKYKDRVKQYQEYERMRLFDTDWYVSQYLQDCKLEIDPLFHYLIFGIDHKYKPNVFFDPIWYAAMYPEVNQKRFTPLEHYCNVGINKGYYPGIEFDTAFYLQKHPDVKKAKVNPLSHYIRCGQREKRIARAERVLFINGQKNSVSSFYRIDQIRSSLQELNFHVETVDHKDNTQTEYFNLFDIIIFFKCSLTPLVERALSSIQPNQITIYDCDDFVFDGKMQASDFEIYDTLDKEAAKLFVQRLKDSHTIARQCDFFTGPTEFLAERASEVVQKGSYVIRNYPPETYLNALEDAKKVDIESIESAEPPINIYYFSGSYSHQKDLKTIEDVLNDLLESHPNTHLHFIGKVRINELPKIAQKIGKQFFIHNYIDENQYYQQLPIHMRKASLVIAPFDLETSYNHGKSELNFIHASAFKIPTVASATDTFKRCIQHGKTGFICESTDEWRECLTQLISDSELRTRLGYKAFMYISQKYDKHTLNDNTFQVYRSIMDQSSAVLKSLALKKNPGQFIPSVRVNSRGARRLPQYRQSLAVEALPSIDISIVTYFSYDWFPAFFLSLVNQGYPLEKINVYIADHSESKEELDLLNSFVEKYRKSFSKINIQGLPNKGFGAGHNANANIAQNDLFLVTNCDLVLPEDAITTLVETALSDFDDVAAWEGRQLPFEHPKFYDPVTLETAWCSGAFVLFRKDAWNAIGGYDDHFFMYCEDVDISFRLRDLGYKLHYVPSSTVWHFSYEEGAASFKPLQACGSLLGHIYIRTRFGNSYDKSLGRQIGISSLRNIRKRIEKDNKVLHQHKKLLIENIKHFQETPKKSENVFPFFYTSHEVAREGAFHFCEKVLKTPLVSIIVRVHGDNTLVFLQEAITTIRNQTYPNIEIIVVEDRGEYSKPYCKSLEEEGVNISFFRSDGNGRSQSGNLGLESASGEYMMFLDYDDYLMADHVETLVCPMLNDEDIAATVGMSWSIHTRYFKEETQQLTYVETLYSRFRAYLKKIDYQSLKTINPMPIQAVLFRSSLYNERGGFDEELPGLEDWELWKRYTKDSNFQLIQKMTSLFRIRGESFHNVDKTQRQQDARKMIQKLYPN